MVKTVMSCNDEKAEEIFLDICRDTGLVSQEKERESFRFIHLTFCEFLAAHEAVEGHKDGFERLIEMHKRLRNSRSSQGVTRLLEVIPFACGLVQRSRRQDIISEIAGLADDRLLARCFLETKAYEHPSWKIFAEGTKSTLLNTPESEWNEKWLQDLHLFNVVVRDAAQCLTHLPGADCQVDLGEFYEELLKRQRGKSLSTLLAAYASHDAPAAFRLAEVTGLDMPVDFPEVIVNNCDQTPFLSLVITAMLLDSNRLGVWAAPLAEAGLSSRLVATSLSRRPADHGVVESYLKKLPARLRWDKIRFESKSLYTQIIALAVGSNPSSEILARSYQRLQIVSLTPARSNWISLQFLFSRYTLVIICAMFVSISGVDMLVRAVGMQTPPTRHPLGTLVLGSIIGGLFYGLLLRASSSKLFYSELLNLGGGPNESALLGDADRSAFSLESSLGRLQLLYLFRVARILMTASERHALWSMRNVGRKLPSDSSAGLAPSLAASSK